ncbi:MAG TPA: WGxxGxxG family protein [Lacipirellulaceae bacterium]|nr:WGxxGxxG family protein [Lacipirellulaceae bacterium]
MWTKLAIWVPTVVVSLALTFAPVIAQDTQDRDVAARTTAVETEDDDGPDLGWLGLIGLLGLAGLMRRDRDVHTHRDTHRDRATHS